MTEPALFELSNDENNNDSWLMLEEEPLSPGYERLFPVNETVQLREVNVTYKTIQRTELRADPA